MVQRIITRVEGSLLRLLRNVLERRPWIAPLELRLWLLLEWLEKLRLRLMAHNNLLVMSISFLVGNFVGLHFGLDYMIITMFNGVSPV